MLRLSSETAPPGNRVNVILDFVASVVKSRVDIADKERWFIESVLQSLPGLNIARNASFGCTIARNRKHIAADGNDDVVICIVTEGMMEVSPEVGETVVLRAGDVYLQSNDIPTRRTFPAAATSFVDVGLPRSLMEAALRGSMGLPLQSKIGTTERPELRLLAGYIRMLNEQFAIEGGPLPTQGSPSATTEPEGAADPVGAAMGPKLFRTRKAGGGTTADASPVLAPAVGAIVATHVHDLVVTALGAQGDALEPARGGGVRAAKLGAVKTEIVARAMNPDLSIDVVAKVCGISPQYVRKLFRKEGTTFTDFVRNERLKKAWRTLTDTRNAHWSVTAIAFECGFADLSYFNRLFRRRYGMTPSDARSLGRAVAAGRSVP